MSPAQVGELAAGHSLLSRFSKTLSKVISVLPSITSGVEGTIVSSGARNSNPTSVSSRATASIEPRMESLDEAAAMDFVLGAERTKESFPGKAARRVADTPRATAMTMKKMFFLNYVTRKK